MKGFYELKDGAHHAHGAPQILESSLEQGTLDELVKTECEGRTDMKKGELPGGFWVAFKDDKTALLCHLETDKDPAPPARDLQIDPQEVRPVRGRSRAW